MSAQCRAGVRYKPRITIRHQCFRQDRLTSKEAQAVRIRRIKDSSNGTLASARMLLASFRPSDSGNFAVTQAQFGLKASSSQAIQHPCKEIRSFRRTGGPNLDPKS